jgi:hypothetical protein
VNDSAIDIPVPVDRRRAVGATFRLHVDDLDGMIWSGFRVFP